MRMFLFMLSLAVSVPALAQEEVLAETSDVEIVDPRQVEADSLAERVRQTLGDDYTVTSECAAEAADCVVSILLAD